MNRASIVTSLALERRLEAVREADAVRMLVVGRRLHDDADRAAGMQDEASGAGDVDQRHDLRAHGENQVGMVMDAVSHGGETPGLATFGSAGTYTCSMGVMSLPFFHSWTFDLCSATNGLMSMIWTISRLP